MRLSSRPYFSNSPASLVTHKMPIDPTVVGYATRSFVWADADEGSRTIASAARNALTFVIAAPGTRLRGSRFENHPAALFARRYFFAEHAAHHRAAALRATRAGADAGHAPHFVECVGAARERRGHRALADLVAQAHGPIGIDDRPLARFSDLFRVGQPERFLCRSNHERGSERLGQRDFMDIFESRRTEPSLHFQIRIAFSALGCEQHRKRKDGSGGWLGARIVQNVVFNDDSPARREAAV